MKDAKEIEARFEHYWQLLGKGTADIFREMHTVPSEESFKRMLSCAYGMGWTESRCALRGDYPTVEQIAAASPSE